MIKDSYPLENVRTASSESLQCIMQVLKRTSKKKKKKKKKKNTGVLISYLFLQSVKFIQTDEKNH